MTVVFFCPLSPFTFQLTSSRRGWLNVNSQHASLKHFNSHPHEEDDFLLSCYLSPPNIISTHILTKRMTEWFFSGNWIDEISTHILTKRMTVCSYKYWPDVLYFNSHPHEEDDSNVCECFNHIFISTHILTKRMTKQYFVYSYCL